MNVHKITKADIPSWLEMRAELWPHCTMNEHSEEILEQLNSPVTLQGFMVKVENQTVGFIEASIHENAHNQFGRAGYIEGWFIEDSYRMSGHGQALVEVAEKWAVDKGCELMASDTEDFNVGSIVAHKKLGYIEKFRADGEVKFIKSLINK